MADVTVRQNKTEVFPRTEQHLNKIDLIHAEVTMQIAAERYGICCFHKPVLIGNRSDDLLDRWRDFGIDNENDPVRIELEIALQRGLHVFPVLVGGARMPRAADLPETIRDFSFRNALEVDAGRDFHLHMERLIHALEYVIQERIGDRPSDVLLESGKASAPSLRLLTL